MILMAPCKELAGISHGYISTLNPCIKTLNYRDKTREYVRRRMLRKTLLHDSSEGDKRDERLPVKSLWGKKLLLTTAKFLRGS